VLAALAVASLVAVLVVVDRGHTAPTDPVKPRSLSILPAIRLVPGSRFERSLAFSWAVSMDIQVPHGVQVVADFGMGPVTFSRSRHVEEVGLGPSTLAMHAVGGRAVVRGLIISDARDGAALLLHRLAELHARLRPDQFPEGADRHDQLHIASTYWTSGFWPGALWQAAALIRGDGSGMFTRWALSATLPHLGGERADTHDVGFEYGQSSLPALQAECHGRAAARRAALCSRLKRSVLAAADELMALERGNARAGTIPTDSQGPTADTIVDSMMNILILPYASRITGNPSYSRVASGHAHEVARVLVRRDGSTAQVVKFDRASGRVLGIGTRQGISAQSTASRGQAWAVYGFSEAALELRDRGLLRVALRTASYVQRHLPPGGIPRWDYDAPRGAPVDLSAGVITSAGLFHLASACAALPGVCGSTRAWKTLARRMLAASLARAYRRPPLGLLPDQVLNEHDRGCWCNGGELIFGLSYGLEALKLARTNR
jgi:unsaturated chondroitin disaccharide hydrolase